MVLAIVAGLACALVPRPAHAEASRDTNLLCSGSPVPCSISTSPHQREGGASMAVVTGRPLTTVNLQLFRLTVVDGEARGMTKLNHPFPVSTNDKGYGQASVPFPAMADDQDGGWVLLAPADTTWGDPGDILGVISTYGARRPTILGDGFGPSKPVGVPLDLQLTNAIQGTRFAVEYFDDDGTWHNVTPGGSSAPMAGRGQVEHVSYVIPQGIPAGERLFRLRNLTDASADPQTWTLTPAVNPPDQPRAKLLRSMVLGDLITGAAARTTHPVRTVLVGAAALGTLGLGAAVAWPAAVLSRRGRRR